ncbi:MAG: cyclase family protein [Planctomycetota bacterium]|jgi:kynurenine formamidase
MTRIIDLSTPHQNFASEPFPPTITHTDHREGARRLSRLAGVTPDDFKDGLALASDQISGSAHSGTHVDAPWHYGPTCEGKPARTIDQVPLEWCYGPGVVLDMRHKEPGSEITVEDIQQALQEIGHTLRPGDIVLIQTGADKYWETPEYLSRQSGLGLAATKWILARGVRTIGIDAWGLDRPAAKMGEAYRAGDPDAIWPAHIYGREKEYLQIEKMANLEKLPQPKGFMVCAFPVMFENASAGWTRAVAIVEDQK